MQPEVFFVRKVVDEEGEEIGGTQDDEDFMQARKGDNLTTLFQCETCHFQNITRREEPVTEKDMEMMRLIRRANLDAFWDRSSTTVAAHAREVRRMDAMASDLGMEPVQRDLGVWPLEDVFGMKVAVLMLKRSLDPGRNEERVQYDTIRKLRACATNLYQAGVGGLTDNVASFERNRLWITTMPTHSYWYHRFMGGFHKRIGEKKKQDEPVLIETLVDLQVLWDKAWEDARDDQTREKVALMATWFLVGFCCGLRGEEMLLIEGHGTKRTLRTTTGAGELSFEVIIGGRTKGNQVRGRRFAIPCVWETGKSLLAPGKWVERLCFLQDARGGLGRFLFQDQDNTLKLKDYKKMFIGTLEAGEREGIRGIKAQCDVGESFGILRSLRRGVTAHARNVGVREEIINAVNRWRKHANSQTGAPRLDMVDVYSQLDAIKPFVLKFSASL